MFVIWRNSTVVVEGRLEICLLVTNISDKSEENSAIRRIGFRSLIAYNLIPWMKLFKEQDPWS